MNLSSTPNSYVPDQLFAFYTEGDLIAPAGAAPHRSISLMRASHDRVYRCVGAKITAGYCRCAPSWRMETQVEIVTSKRNPVADLGALCSSPQGAGAHPPLVRTQQRTQVISTSAGPSFKRRTYSMARFFPEATAEAIWRSSLRHCRISVRLGRRRAGDWTRVVNAAFPQPPR